DQDSVPAVADVQLLEARGAPPFLDRLELLWIVVAGAEGVEGVEDRPGDELLAIEVEEPDVVPARYDGGEETAQLGDSREPGVNREPARHVPLDDPPEQFAGHPASQRAPQRLRRPSVDERRNPVDVRGDPAAGLRVVDEPEKGAARIRRVLEDAVAKDAV